MVTHVQAGFQAGVLCGKLEYGTAFGGSKVCLVASEFVGWTGTTDTPTRWKTCHGS